MQDHTSPSSLEDAIALQKYGVGQPVRRKEDDRLVRGQGKYTDDVSLPNQACAWMVRSSHAHGIIKRIETSAAKTMPSVLGVWTGADLASANYNPFICGLPLKSRDGSPLLQTNRPALATDKVRFVGDPLAVVVAETAAQARDAAEAVEVDIEPLPAVTNAAEAAKPGAPQLYEHIPNNVALDYLPVGQPGPLATDPCRARARCRRQVPGGAHFGLWQSRRLHHRRRAGAAVGQHRQESCERLSYAAAYRRHQDGLDQHHVDGGLSRRRTARSQLLHGTADRSRRRRDGDQPRHLAQEELHQAGATAVRSRFRHDL